MFKKFSIALLVTMFVVATPAFCNDAKKAEEKAVKVEEKAVKTEEKAEGKAEGKSEDKKTADSKDAAKESWFTKGKAAVVAAPGAVYAFATKDHPLYAAAIATVSAVALLYTCNDNFNSMVNGWFGSSDEKCGSFCEKRK